MTSLIRRSALVICLLAVAAQAGAQVVLVSQSRSVYADAWLLDYHSDSLSAPDFGLFEEDISASAASPFDGFAVGSATQVSEVQTGHFSIHGTASFDAQDGGWSNPIYAHSNGRSSFEVLFEVSEPTPFSFAGALAHSGASLQLDRDGAPYLSFEPEGNNEIISVSEVGIFEPGAYTLTVKATASTEGGSQNSSFDIDFFLEAPVAVDQMDWGQLKAMFR